MQEFIIVTDSNADMAPGYAKKNGVVEMELTYTIGGNTYACNDPALSRHDFYDQMRGGEMPKTAAVNVGEVSTVFREILDQQKDILCLTFSSALSATCNNMQIAAEELSEHYPDRKIRVVDTLCASAGEGMLVDRAVNYRAAGLSLDETEARIRTDIPHIAHLFTVDDLFHLQRGGRVSKATAIVGSMLSIKPTLHVDDAGRLIPTGKVRGRKQSLLALVNGMEQQMDKERCDQFFISHGDCLADAEFVASEITRRFNISRHVITFVGPTIGAHSGPGTVALFFYAKNR